jgi:hypothetical protein
VLRRLNLFDLNIDPINNKGVTGVPMEGVEEAEECELCENPVDGIIRGADNSEDPEMEVC